MREVSTLDLRRKSGIKPSTIFIYAVMFLFFSPLAGIYSMSGMVGDTAIQIKIGLDDLSMGRLLTEEIYSWHEGLVFTAHESGWYLLLGIMYKLFKIWGVVAVGAVFNYATGCTALSYNKDKAHPFMVAVVIVLTQFLNGYPDYNVRPSVTSIFAVTLLVVAFMKDMKSVTRSVIFAVCCFFMGWLQGGMLPLYLVLFIVFIVIELLYRNFRDAGILGIGLVAGFITSLLNPMGIRCYTFGMIQSTATDIWAMVDEWNPMHFNILQILLILLVFVGFIVGDGIRKFDRKQITELALLCMFFILTCVYKRFVAYYSVMFLLFAPEQLQRLLSWFVSTVLKVRKEIKLDFSGSLYGILTGACAVMLIALGFMYIPRFLPTGTMSDIEAMAAYDPKAVEFVKERGYERMFNSFNTGTWLAFNDVKVHIDNRIDPYLEEFSGVDYIRDQMNCSTIADMDVFRARHDCDAFFLDMPDGYSYLLYEIERYAPDRYRIVYDNVVESTIPEVANTRFVIIECI